MLYRCGNKLGNKYKALSNNVASNETLYRERYLVLQSSTARIKKRGTPLDPETMTTWEMAAEVYVTLRIDLANRFTTVLLCLRTDQK